MTAATTRLTARTGTGREVTARATRAHGPVLEASASPTRGTNGQNSFRPHTASAAGSTTSANAAAIRSPAADVGPRPRVPGSTASTRVSRESTTVTLEASTAGPVATRASRSATRWSSVRRSSSR